MPASQEQEKPNANRKIYANTIITAAFLGFHLSVRDALEIAALWLPTESLDDKIRDYCAAFES